MPIVALILAAQFASAAPQPTGPAPPCKATQLRLSFDGADGRFNGMSHAGGELSTRNHGPDCLLPGLPRIQLRDKRGRLLQTERQVPVGMHPGPVITPVQLAGGHRAAIDLQWTSGPVYPHSRSVRAARVTVRWGVAILRAPLSAVLYGPAGKPVPFNQAPLRAVEGMPAG